MPYSSIHDDSFSDTVTLAEAYRLMVAFVEQYNARGESSTVALLTDVGLVPGGQSADGERTDKRGSVAWPSSRLLRSTSSRTRRQQTKLRRAGQIISKTAVGVGPFRPRTGGGQPKLQLVLQNATVLFMLGDEHRALLRNRIEQIETLFCVRTLRFRLAVALAFNSVKTLVPAPATPRACAAQEDGCGFASEDERNHKHVQTDQGAQPAHSHLSFAFASARVCHCMFDGRSAPPRFSGLMWSTT